MKRVVIGLLLMVAGGCHGTDGTSAGEASAQVTTTSNLPCPVDDVLARRCRGCHGATPTFGAPMPLMTWDDLHRPAPSTPSRPVYEVVGERIHSEVAPMPKAPLPRLAPADTRVMDDWLAAGAPRTTQDCSSSSPDGGTDPAPLACSPDQHIVPQHPWAMPADHNDEYVCFGLDIAVSEKRHVIAFAPKIDNRKIVHHIVVFQSDRSVSSEPHVCSPSTLFQGRMVYGWAPGGQNLVLPQEAGFPLEGTAHYVVQMHYNNVNHLSGETDSSGIDLCTTSTLRPNDADVMAFGTQRIEIAPRSTRDVTCGFDIPANLPDLHVFAAMPHMHQLGKTLSNTLKPAGGGAVDLGTQSVWDFNNQAWLPVNATVSAGSHVETRCAWTNPTDATVRFGEATSDEMCYAFTMYYPRIRGVHWAAPATASRCAPTSP